MSKPGLTTAKKLALAALVLAMSSHSLAQSSSADLAAHLEHANQALVQLDEKALTCLSSFNLNLGEAAALLCDEFMRAVDGELLAGYISNCEVLKSWAHERSGSTDQSADSQSSATMEMVGSIEASCGENALQTRTSYVVTAFNTLAQGSLLNKTTTQSIENRLSALEQQNRIDRERRALQQAIETQRLQREQATQSQLRSIENELIRQQINNQK